MNKKPRHSGRLEQTQNGQSGQSLVLVAVAMVVLLLFTGLALDTGMVYVRRIQLSRAVDAAALGAVVELPQGEDIAEVSARGLMAANGVNPGDLHDFRIETSEDPTESTNVMTVYGKWRIPTIFMRLIGIATVDVEASATAEFHSFISMFSGQTGESGKLGPVNLSIFGPWQTPSYGDAYSCVKTHQNGKPGDYRPDQDPDAEDNPYHDDFPDGYPFSVHIPASVNGWVRVEILDPDCYNKSHGHNIVMTNTYPLPPSEPVTDTVYDDENWADAYSIDRGIQDPNQFWFVRMDEIREYAGHVGGDYHSYDHSYSTRTEYRLYYLAERADDSVEKVLIASYMGEPDGWHTDLTWVCPGGSAPNDPHSGVTGYNGFPASFEVNTNNLTDIVLEDDGSRSLFLEVQGVSGWSENGFDLWAGPATDENINMPAGVNERNLYIEQQRAQGVQTPHDSSGMVVYGSGVLPLNVNQSTMYTVTLAYIPPEAAGIHVRVYHWDTDVGGQSITYKFEGYPTEYPGVLSGGNSWKPPETGYDRLQVPGDFVGGFLYAQYRVGRQHTSTWRLEYEEPVDDTFVRLTD